MNRILFMMVLTIAIFSTSGCGIARGRYDVTPIDVPGPAEKRTMEQVPAFRVEALPPNLPACIPIANVYADGNGFAWREELEEELREQASEVGADYVVIDNIKVSNDETGGTYGGGLMLSGQIQRPHQAGYACRASKVKMGAHFDGKSYKIKYVYPNSAAAKAGFVEGEEILSADGVYLGGTDRYAWYRTVSVKQPGQKVVFEVLNRNGEKITREVTLLPADPWP